MNTKIKIMKNRLLFLALLLVIADSLHCQTPKWGFGDTIDAVNNMDPTYFNNYWFEDWVDSAPREKVFSQGINNTLPWYMLDSYDTIARFYYTDHPIKIAGIAVSVVYYKNREPNSPLLLEIPIDTIPCLDSLFLIDAKPDSFAVKAQVSMPPDLSAPHRFMRYPSDSYRATDTCGYGNDVINVVPVYEMYFTEPVTVDDSFYVGMTNCYKAIDNDYRWVSEYTTSVTQLGFNHIIDTKCPHPLPFLRYYMVWYDYHVGRYISRYENSWSVLMFFFPLLVPDTGCAAVEGIQVAAIDSGHAQLVWNRTEGHTRWEVSYGTAGIMPDSGTVVICNDTTAILDSIADGVPYWAYVRAICERYDSIYYTDWSPAVEIFRPILYNVTAEANYPERGLVEGGGVYEAGSEAVLLAHALSPYNFLQWDDGDTANPRHILVTQDTSFTALFVNREGIEHPVSSESLFMLLPNPAWETVQVLRNGSITDGTLAVVDVTGHEVFRQAVVANVQSVTLHVETLPEGVYFVTLTTDRGCSTKKLVVKR